MSALAAILDIPEAPVTGVAPAFPVEQPDGRRDWRELDRQVAFRDLMRTLAPRVYVYANANAGKRNPRQAMREGIKAGVFDLELTFQYPLRAQIEMKGYDARGRAGTLSTAQIEHGNRMVELGVPVACFFDPIAAVDWVRDLGFPVRAAR